MQRRRHSIRPAKLSGLKRYHSDGVYYVYHRKTGIPLPADLPEDHPEFLKAYLEAEGAAPPQKAHKGTLAYVWTAYARSEKHNRLSSSYRRGMDLDAARLMNTAGHVPIHQIRAKHINSDLSKLSAHAARKRRKTWRAIMSFALRAGHISEDPSATVKAPQPPKATPYAFWTSEDIKAFRLRWPIGTAQRLAFELLFWTGARISDVVRMGDSMVDRGGWLSFRQQKTGGLVEIPLHRQAPDFADPTDLTQLHECLAAITDRHMTWLTTRKGKSRSIKAASQWFSAAARSAGIKGKSAHGLRATRAIALAEAGASTHQIGAWTGHETLQEINHYSQQANRRKLLTRPKEEHKVSREDQT